MNMLYVLIGIYTFMILVAIGAIVYIFPFRKLLWNRWKLKIQGMRKPVSPVLILYKNNYIEEIVVDTSQETFTHDEATYNIRPNKFYSVFAFKYLFYIHNNPEPMDLQVDEKGLVYFKAQDGQFVKVPVVELFQNPDGQYIAGKIIDGKTYDNLLIRAYNAGMAWMARNSNKMEILMWIILGLAAAGLIMTYWKGGQVENACVTAIRNMTINLSSGVRTI